MNKIQKISIFMVALGLPAGAAAWRLAAGGGLLAGLVPGTAFGWQFTGQWTRSGYAGQRWLLEADVGQYATEAAPGAWLERGRAASLLAFWERRTPLSYAFRPWLGIGGGISRYRFDERQRLNDQGYAIASYPAIVENDADLAVTMSVPLARSWSVALTAQTGFPSRISTVSMTVLWRLF
jgi:hypothetical protein